MSRIGKRPIPLPKGVTITPEEDGTVTVKGPKGTLVRRLSPDIKIREDNGNLLVERPSDAKEHRAMDGLTPPSVANWVEGVTNGSTRQLEVQGVGFRASVQGQNLA